MNGKEFLEVLRKGFDENDRLVAAQAKKLLVKIDMSDKQQLAAIGEHIAEHSCQVQPLRMAKRIEELDERAKRAERALMRLGFTYSDGAEEWKPPIGPSAVPLLGRIKELEEMLAEAREMMDNQPRGFSGMIKRIYYATSGKLPVLAAPVVPEGWQLVPTSMDDNMLNAWRVAPTYHAAYIAMLAAAPKPDTKP